MSDRHWMELAVAQARKALGNTAPNPAVGAVLVRENRLLAVGHTQPAGDDHAEVAALAAARADGHDLNGATMYITLEPCCHHGRTPPCTDALIAAGIERVVVGVLDDFPPMRGNGLEQLRNAGLKVALGVCGEECSRLVLGFKRVVCNSGLPEITCKAAVSLDGNIATAGGDSQWISGAEARSHGHALRAEHDAILVGIGTVLADNPRLTCRVEGGADPVPVVLDSNLRIPRDSRLFESSKRPVIVCAQDAPERDIEADVIRVPRAGAGIDVTAAAQALGEKGLHRILVEGGGRVHRSLLDADLVDNLYVYVSAVIVPGGTRWVGGEPISSLSEALRLPKPTILALGPDVVLHYALATKGH